MLAFEPEHDNVVADAAAGRRLLDELRSAHLKVVLDAANLIRPGELARQRETLREAFALLGDTLVLAHAKDVRDDGTIVAAGRGGLHYALYVELLRDAGYTGPLVLHGLREDEVPESVRFVRGHLGLRSAAEIWGCCVSIMWVSSSMTLTPWPRSSSPWDSSARAGRWSRARRWTRSTGSTASGRSW